MMTQILPVAIRGIMDKHVRDTLTDLCNFFDVVSRKSITLRRLTRLQEEIVVILCELEIYFPPAFFDIMVHLLIHVVDDIIHLGPSFLHNMMPFERLNGIIKGYVRNRAKPDASIVQGWLTEECVSFCQNYMQTEEPVGLPVNKHLGRLEGVGHRTGRKELHVLNAGRRADFDRANLVALQHITMVEDYCIEHKASIKQKYSDLGRAPPTDAQLLREHNSTFLGWFKKKLQDNPPPMNCSADILLYALSHGPAHNLVTYQSYDINGYTFCTEKKDSKSDYQNSGVTMEAYIGDVKTRYYGRIEEIWELNYSGDKMPMFRVRWAKNVIKEERGFITMVIPEAKSIAVSVNVTAQNEPWVLADQVAQCFFITDPSKPSRVVVRRGKRNIAGMDGVAHEQDFGQYGDPKLEDDDDHDNTRPYTTRRSRTTLPPRSSGLPFLRRSQNVPGLNYATATKKGKKIVKR